MIIRINREGYTWIHWFIIILLYLLSMSNVNSMSLTYKKQLREKTLHMFRHAYSNYMTHAYPADELMPLSCSGRYRGSHPSRGDIDDSLGNFSLTLVDSLDTLALLGEVESFDEAVRLVIKDVTFDTDVVVSVFETNIRVLGGLLGGHVMSEYYKEHNLGLSWYAGELLEKAVDLAQRLLKAFDTSSGLPYPRVNLRHGIKGHKSRTGHEKDTCTSCAGTMILEFAALSRLTGDPIYEEKGHAAMDFLWRQRHRVSDLVGTVINIHNGDWVRRESGIGAGIDSYYEYLLKGYVLLGEEKYLTRFNKHYEAIMRYINQGPLMLNVHMHKPHNTARNYMDALLAFWPGLQVLKGDIRPAIEIHEMLYQVIQKHNFLPEAFTTDFRVHWAQHPLRPEFIESTYFLYQATGDPHYLEVGELVLENLEKHGRVKCGYAAIKDVSTGKHEDQMDSYVLAETFKYLYLLFSEKEDLIVDVDDFVFTTEAHLLPLSLGVNNTKKGRDVVVQMQQSNQSTSGTQERTCTNTKYLFPGDANYAQTLRDPLKNFVSNSCPINKATRSRLRASNFVAGDKKQMATLGRMGIKIMTMSDGRVQLLHTASEAVSPEDADDGLLFMEEMIDLSRQQQQQEIAHEPRLVQILSAPYFGEVTYTAGPAQFGLELTQQNGLSGKLAVASPIQACTGMQNVEHLRGKIVLVERGQCMFVDKARQIQAAGAIGGIVVDNTPDLSAENAPMFAMSGDGKNDVNIPLVFLFRNEANKLLDLLTAQPDLNVYIGRSPKKAEDIVREFLVDRDQTESLSRGESSTLAGPPREGSPSGRTQCTNKKTETIDNVADKSTTMGTSRSDQHLLDSIIDKLERYTNFGSLDNINEAMAALSDMIKMPSERSVESQRIMDDMLNKLELSKTPNHINEKPQQSQKHPEKCYENDDVAPSQEKAEKKSLDLPDLSDIIDQLKEAPEWLDMKGMTLFMDKDGNFYVKDLANKIKQFKKQSDATIEKNDESNEDSLTKDKTEDEAIIVDKGTLAYDPSTSKKNLVRIDSDDGRDDDDSGQDSKTEKEYELNVGDKDEL